MVEQQGGSTLRGVSVQESPDGLSVGPRRVPQCRLNMKEYLHEANDEVLIVVQVETRQAVGSMDEILAVECIDAFFTDPYDLSASLGYLD